MAANINPMLCFIAQPSFDFGPQMSLKHFAPNGHIHSHLWCAQISIYTTHSCLFWTHSLFHSCKAHWMNSLHSTDNLCLKSLSVICSLCQTWTSNVIIPNVIFPNGHAWDSVHRCLCRAHCRSQYPHSCMCVCVHISTVNNILLTATMISKTCRCEEFLSL